MRSFLALIYEVEEVAEKEGMLLISSNSQVQELLIVAIEVWEVLEQVIFIYQWYERYVASGLLD